MFLWSWQMVYTHSHGDLDHYEQAISKHWCYDRNNNTWDFHHSFQKHIWDWNSQHKRLMWLGYRAIRGNKMQGFKNFQVHASGILLIISQSTTLLTWWTLHLFWSLNNTFFVRHHQTQYSWQLPMLNNAIISNRQYPPNDAYNLGKHRNLYWP
jgi:hypothetical protein